MGIGYAIGAQPHMSETITLRDAVHTSMTFDIFNRHAGKPFSAFNQFFSQLDDEGPPRLVRVLTELDEPDPA